MGKLFFKIAIIFFLFGIFVISILLLISDLDSADLEQKRTWSLFMIDLFISVSVWIGMAFIVTGLWKLFPWEKMPMKHLILEISAVLLWPTIIIFLAHSISVTVFGEMLMVRSIISNILLAITITALITALHESIFFYIQWKKNFDKSVKLEKAHLEAQYETLKNQINPHFLFNSLNTLLTYVENNTVATEYVQNLSDFMRYVLQSRSKEACLLRDELEIAEKYSFLQQSRFGKNLRINFDVPEKYYHYSIIPLALQMLIENAIKHNVAAKDRPLHIDVFVNADNYLTVKNNLQKKFDVSSTKLGLANIKERYRFLSAKEVKINESGTEFYVALPLITVSL